MACSDDFCPLSVRVLRITRAQSAWDVVAFDAASDNATNVNEPNPLLALFVCRVPNPTQPNPTLRSILMPTGRSVPRTVFRSTFVDPKPIVMSR